jgi:O-antigen/teichoic acid export membrane protein
MSGTLSPAPDAEGSEVRLGKIARGGALMLGGSGLESLLGFALAVVAGRLLGKHDFGLFNLAWQIVALSLVLSELGLPVAVLRYVAVYDGERDPEGAKGAAYGGTVVAGVLGVVLGIVLVLGAPTIAERVFHKPEMAPLLPAMALQLPLVGIMVTLLRVTQARGSARHRVLVEKALLPASRLLFIGGLLAAGGGVVGAAWGSTIAGAVGCVASIACTAALARRAWPGARPRWRELWPVLVYSIPLVISTLALFGRRRGILMVLGARGTAGDVGLYAAAERTALAGAMGLNAIGSIFSPIAADLYHRKQHDELGAVLKTSAAWIVMVVLPGALLLALCPRDVLLAFGRDFPEAEFALGLLGLAQAINCAYGSVDFLIQMTAKQWGAVLDLTLFALISMGLTYYLAPRMGVAGAAIAGAVGLLGPRTARVIQVAVRLHMNPFGPGHLRVAACAVPPALLALLWRGVLSRFLPAHAFWWLIVPGYAALYLLLLPVLAKGEVATLRQAIQERRKRRAQDEAEAGDAGEVESPE